MYDGYFGKITNDVYLAALELRGDDETCWDESVLLAEPPLVFGPSMPEELSGDEVIEIWEAAHAEAKIKFGEGNYEMESVTLFLVDNQNTSASGEMEWKMNVKRCK